MFYIIKLCKGDINIMIGKIYKIVDTRTNTPIYIGQTLQTLVARFNGHFNHNSYVAQYMVKQGEDNFNIELIEQIDIDIDNYEDIIRLNDLEKKYIHIYQKQYSLINKIDYNSSKSFEDSISDRNLGTSFNRIRCINTNELFTSIQEACEKYNLSVLSMFKVLKDPNKTLGFDENNNPLHWEYCDKPAEAKQDNTYALYMIYQYKDNQWEPTDIGITMQDNVMTAVSQKYNNSKSLLGSDYTYMTLATNIQSKYQAEVLRRLWISQLQLYKVSLKQPLIEQDQLMPSVLCIETREYFVSIQDAAKKFNLTVQDIHDDCSLMKRNILKPYNFQYITNIMDGNYTNNTYAIYAFIYNDMIKYIFYTNKSLYYKNDIFFKNIKNSQYMLRSLQNQIADVKIKLLHDLIETEEDAKNLCAQYNKELIPKNDNSSKSRAQIAQERWDDSEIREYMLKRQNTKHAIIDTDTQIEYPSIGEACKQLSISVSTMRRHLSGAKESININNQLHHFKYIDEELNKKYKTINNTYGVYTIDYLSIPQVVFITKGNPQETLQAHKCHPKKSLYNKIQEKGYDKFTVTPVQVNLASKEEAQQVKMDYIKLLDCKGIKLIVKQ